MKLHELKTWPRFYAALASGLKHFELRRNDRDFQVGDMLRLREWDPATGEYSGRQLHRRVTYILKHDRNAGCAATFGLAAEYVIMSLEDQ